MADSRDVTAPTILLAIAGVIFTCHGYYVDGLAGVGSVVGSVGFHLAIQVPLAVVACWFVANWLNISFGTIGVASLKLAAILAFTWAATFFIPYFYVRWVMVYMLYYAQLAMFFELEGRVEILICAGMIWLVQTIVYVTVWLLLVAAGF